MYTPVNPSLTVYTPFILGLNILNIALVYRDTSFTKYNVGIDLRLTCF